MKTQTSTTELLRMTPAELRREITLHQTEFAKMRMGVEMQKEKNHALYKFKRREIARMKTMLTQMTSGKAAAAPAKKSDTSASPILSEKPSQKVKKPVKVASSKSKKS